MAVAAYSAWQHAGRPVDPARPIAEIVERLKEAFPEGDDADLFSYYANESHYTAVPAEDHTPFSQTGWPNPSPQWFVFATDIMDRPDLGVDCDVLFAYWIVEARAGRMPWLKYMNWQGKQYRARGYGGETVAFRTAWTNSGHFDHIHLSVRTDFINASLGSWSLIPGSPVPPEVDDVPMYFRAIPSGRQCVTNGTSWAHITTPRNLDNAWFVARANGVNVPKNESGPGGMPEIPDEVLDGGTGVFGPQTNAPVVAVPGSGGIVTPEQLAQLVEALKSVLDGVTVKTTIDTP